MNVIFRHKSRDTTTNRQRKKDTNVID